VLRLSGDRALKKAEHWRGVAIAASEQSGRTRVPVIEPVASLPQWLAQNRAGVACLVLSLRDAKPFHRVGAAADMLFLSGPEGGLSPAEESLALGAGFEGVSLGDRVLRADTAPMAVLSALSLMPSTR
jgi:16S rRNA (uracil1498-N3)-methyltransferase